MLHARLNEIRGGHGEIDGKTDGVALHDFCVQAHVVGGLVCIKW
jgi:hypothetical protein